MLKRTSIDYLLVLRGIASVTVLFNHFISLVWEDVATNLPFALRALLFPFGFQAVWLFFVLSSFLLTKAFLQGRFELSTRSLKSFFASRAWRLLPLFYIGQLTLILLALFDFLPRELPFSLGRELQYLLLDPRIPYRESLNPVHAMNSPIWSVIIEIHFILLTPLLYWIGWKSPKALLGLLVIWVIYLTALYKNGSPIFPEFYFNHAYNIGFFMTGALAAFFASSARSPVVNKKYGILVGAVTWLLCQFLATANLDLALSTLAPIGALGFAVLVYALNDSYIRKLPQTVRELAPSRPFFLGLLETLGVMSYSIYLLHKPIVYIFLFKLMGWATESHDVGQRAIASVIGFIAVIAASAVAYLHVETKFRIKKLAWVSAYFSRATREGFDKN